MLFHLQMVFSVLCNGEYNYTWRRGKYLTEIVMAHCNALPWHAVNRMCKNCGPSFSAINTTVRLKLDICAKQPRCIIIRANLLIMSSVHAWCCLHTEKYLQISNAYFNTCTVHLLLFCTMTNKCTIISQIITLLHVLTLSCHPQGACNQCLAKFKYFKCRCWQYSL
jgi:hypothetical protein